MHLETVVGPATLLFHFGRLDVEVFQRLLERRQHGLNTLAPFSRSPATSSRLVFQLLSQLKELLRAPLSAAPDSALKVSSNSLREEVIDFFCSSMRSWPVRI